MKKLPALLSVISLVALPLAACGGSDSSSTTSSTTSAPTGATGGGTAAAGGGGTVDVAAAQSGLAFEQKTLSASAGSDTFNFDNPQSVTHDFCIEDSSGNEVTCSDQIAGDTTSVTADLEPGTYTFYCSVDAHRDAGMEGTLTVK